jgi:hypothetical protein
VCLKRHVFVAWQVKLRGIRNGAGLRDVTGFWNVTGLRHVTGAPIVVLWAGGQVRRVSWLSIHWDSSVMSGETKPKC